MTNDDSPLVSGISPVEGPPGTNVKIRGENLGTGPEDILGVFICNVNCTYTAEWKSSSLIHARTGPGKGLGDIIVFTKSGKMGTSLVKFRGITPRVGLLTEAAVWVDESKLFEEKAKTTLSTSRAVATSSTYVDPLGVAPEETGAVLSPDQIEQWYPGCSSNPLSENFNPARFLLERHLDTSFDTLKSGYYHLQSQDTRTSVGPASFVRGNLATIFDALSTLNDVQKSMIVHENESIGGNICEELLGVLKSCSIASDILFKDILARKDECDSKRNVLNVLHRYRFLFNLPRSIEKNIQQSEYEILISDYNRAKALFLNTEVKSFKKALSEVDQKIAAFSKKLKQKLFDFPTPLEEQKKIIRYLNDLDYPNAGWECIKNQSLWIKSLLLDCQVEHQMKENCMNALSTSHANSRHSNITLVAPSFTRSASETHAQYTKSHQRTPLPESLRRMQSEPTSTPKGILMIEELCKLISDNLPDLWNLGQSYISNQLGEKMEDIAKVNEERTNFQAIVKDAIIVFCEMVQTVLQPDEIGRVTSTKENKILIPWLPGAVKNVRTTLQKLDKLGLTNDVLKPLKTLTKNCIADCIKKVLSATIEEVNNLFKQETWELQYERKNLYWVSKLPRLFEKIFTESIQFVHDFMTDSKIEAKNENRALHNEIAGYLKTMIETFLMTLEKTVYRGNSDSSESLHVSAEDNPNAVPKDFQVLVSLSNCYFIKNCVAPNIIDLSVKCGYDEINSLKEEIDNAIDKLDERVFNTYIDIKGEPLVGSIELGMNMAEYDWNGTQPVEGVRPYVQDLLLKLIFIHDQVSSVSPLFNKRIFGVLIDLIVDELQRIYECIDKFSNSGTLQALLEIQAVRHSLQEYITNKTSEKFDSIVKRLPALDEISDKKLQKLIGLFKESMRYQLVTFAPQEETAPSDPKERYRSQSVEMLSNKGRKKSATNQENRDRAKSNVSVKQMEGVKSDLPPRNKSVTSNINDNTMEAKSKKTKRRAPPLPSVLASTPGNRNSAETRLDPSNPFLDDDEDV